MTYRRRAILDTPAENPWVDIYARTPELVRFWMKVHLAIVLLITIGCLAGCAGEMVAKQQSECICSGQAEVMP